MANLFFASKYDNLMSKLVALLKTKKKFTRLFAEEEKYVIEHNINKIEKISVLKNQLHGDLSKELKDLNIEVSRFVDSSEDSAMRSLSEMKADFDFFIENSTDKFSPSDNRKIDKIKYLFNEVIIEFIELKPAIEKNRYLVETLLHHHQQSYKFWSDVIKERNAQYNKQGSINKSKTISQVCAKA